MPTSTYPDAVFPPAPRSEILSLTGLRGLAALYVVLFHFYGHVNIRGAGTRFISNGYLSVEVFFVLSGFVLAMQYGRCFTQVISWGEYRRFLWKRIARIYPLYLFTTLVSAVFFVLGMNFGIARPRLTFLANVLLVQNWMSLSSYNPFAWSISTEWTSYLCMPLLVLAFMRRQLWVLVPCLGVAFLYAFLRWHLDADNGWSSVARCVVEFTIGIWTFHLASFPRLCRLAGRPWFSWGALAILFAALFTPLGYPIVFCVCPWFILALFSTSGGASRLFSNMPVHRLGQLSYSLYLTQFFPVPLIAAVHRGWQQHGHRHGNTAGVVAAAMLLIILVPLCYRYVEQPGREWLRHLGEARQHGAGDA